MDFEIGSDHVDLSNLSGNYNFKDLDIQSNSSGDATFTLDYTTVTLVGVYHNSLTEDDFIF